MAEAPSFIHALYDAPFASALRESEWTFPVVQTVHILGLLLFYGSIALVDLRILGVALKGKPARDVAGALLPIAWIDFAFMVASGSLLFAAQAEKIYSNVFLLSKFALMVLAGVNLVVFNTAGGRQIALWGAGEASAPSALKVSAAVSFALWSAVVIAGRFIAYFGSSAG